MAPSTPSSVDVTDHRYDALLLGIAHREFLHLDLDAMKKEVSVVYDVKGMLGNGVDAKL